MECDSVHTPLYAGDRRFVKVIRSKLPDRWYTASMQNDDLEQAVDIALEGAPRAERLAAMIETLRTRRAGLLRDLEATDDSVRQQEIRKQIAELDRQVDTLSEQQAVSHFVEMSVRAAAMRPEEIRAVYDEDE